MRSLFMTFFLFFTLPIYAKTLVISDIDDTIRLTHRTADLLEQLSYVSDPTLAFKGLPEIYRSLDQNGAVIAYVSGTVAPISGFAEDLLEENDFPQSENFYFKGWFDDTKDFKVQAIESLIISTRPDDILLIGDNGEADVAAYELIAQRYSNVTVYMHKLYSGPGHEVPTTQNIFLTGADLALDLHQKQMLTEDQTQEAVSIVSQATASGSGKEQSLVLPAWATPSYEEVTGLYSSSSLYPKWQSDLEVIRDYLILFFDLQPAVATP